MSKRTVLLTCFILSIAWGVYERYYGIEIRDQVFLAFMFGISIIWIDG